MVAPFSIEGASSKVGAVQIDRINSAADFGSIVAGLTPLSRRLKPSASPTSKFRKWIGICYEAMDQPSTDPVRGIKAFVKEWQAMGQLHKRLTGSTEPPWKI
jgi:hypothetical protein